MSEALPRLRLSLDFMPSPDPERPGLLMRDRYGFSDTILIIPPPLVPCLACFDGEQTELELRADLVRATGQIQVGDLEKQLYDALSHAGFLEDDRFAQLRDRKTKEFAEAPAIPPSHAGSAYPEERDEAAAMLTEFMTGQPAYPENHLIGIAAPHVSPHGGWESYRDAYAALTPAHRDKTFVILGTSHYGEAEHWGLSRRPFQTPFGEAITDMELVDELAEKSPGAVRMEDYCYSIEHSIEFQILFLQHLFGPHIRILPILCGSFLPSILKRKPPEDNDEVHRFLGTLGEIAAREKERLFWVLGVDMAHMGRRYGDALEARADQGEMLDVAQRDQARMDRIAHADAAGFWDLIQEKENDLKWCGSEPFYTFLKAAAPASGKVRRYQQWNIEEQSVVSFGAMTFHGS